MEFRADKIKNVAVIHGGIPYRKEPMRPYQENMESTIQIW